MYILHLFWPAAPRPPLSLSKKKRKSNKRYVNLEMSSHCKNCACSSVCIPVLHVHLRIAPLLGCTKVMALENWRHILKCHVHGVLISVVLELRAWIFWETTRSIYLWLETLSRPKSGCWKPVLFNKISQVVAASCLFLWNHTHSYHILWVFPHCLQPSSLINSSQEFLPFLSVTYFFLPLFSTNYSYILPHFILPSISWSTSWSFDSKFIYRTLLVIIFWSMSKPS
jgi:hypothetical protein